MNMLEVMVKGAETAARRDDPSAASQTAADLSGRSPKLAALVAPPVACAPGVRPSNRPSHDAVSSDGPICPAGRSGLTPQDHFVGLRPTAPCPFCGNDPPLAAQLHGRFIVGCESDDCHVNPQVSGQSLSEAWARWNKRQEGA